MVIVQKNHAHGGPKHRTRPRLAQVLMNHTPPATSDVTDRHYYTPGLRSCTEKVTEFLLAKRYEYAEWKVAVRVNLDYHVDFEKSYYSVHYHYAQKQVDVRATARTIEIFFEHKRIATHARSYKKYSYSTLKEHMPRSHQAHLEWPPSRIITWAQKVGASSSIRAREPVTAASVFADGRLSPCRRLRSIRGLMPDRVASSGIETRRSSGWIASHSRPPQ